MTAQMSDTVVYRDKTYRLVAADGAELFDPSQIGLKPIPTSTANWRGFRCRYVVDHGRLVLDGVLIGLKQPARLFSREPVQDPIRERVPELALNTWTYADLGHPIEFSGELLLGDGFIKGLYEHMGFHPASKYRTVLKLVFDKGRLTDVSDESANLGRPGLHPRDNRDERLTSRTRSARM